MNKILQTLVGGFTYEGSVKHCIINYSLIVITVLPHLIKEKQARKTRDRWFSALLTSTFVQVFLWFSLNAIGVSVIWCAVGGFNLIHYRTNVSRLDNKTKALFAISSIMVLLGVLYYCIVLPPVSTIAHTMALIMGIVLFYLFRNLNNSKRFQ